MKMKITATGDNLMQTRLPEGYDDFQAVKDYIMQGNARISNIETSITKYDCFGSTYCGGHWLNAEPDIVPDMLSYGFNLLSCANNHSMDYSYDGLASTMKYLDQTGVPYAGVGTNLYEASKPAVIATKYGRVALISICSTFEDAARAGDQCKAMPGRPGLNPLRFKQIYYVNPDQMKVLKEIAASTCLNSFADNSRKRGFRGPLPEGVFAFGGSVSDDGIFFKEGKGGERTSYCNERDLKRTIDTIENAKRYADYIVVMYHSHENKGDTYTQPDYFIEQFSHACIDAGACAIFGTGTHQLKGIELYKGYPIFYSLGNFVFQSESPRLVPADFYEKFDIPVDTPAAEAFEIRGKGRMGLHTYNSNFRSLIPYLEFDDGKLTKLEVRPIELNFESAHHLTGFPRLATGKDAQEIFEYMCERNKDYGTEMIMENDTFKVKLG